LLRKGRFDELFFVDLPAEDERKDIITLYIRRNLLKEPSPDTLAKLIAQSDGFAGADLEGAVRDVAIQAVIHGDEIVNDDLFLKCFNNIVPLSKTAPERIEAIRLWGRERAVPASGVAWDSPQLEKPIGKRTIIL
jgi:SpoVK/Ycf46/Vps4 family AAA+-type ATPase